MFVDELEIYAKAGDGGNGVVRWRHEKFRPMAGPSGGDGGNAGDVTVTHDGTMATSDLRDKLHEVKGNVVSGEEFEEQRNALKTSVDAAAITAAQQQSPATRLVKFAISHGERSVVVFWGGTIELHDASGKTTARGKLPQDITAATADGKTLILGLADGRLFITP